MVYTNSSNKVLVLTKEAGEKIASRISREPVTQATKDEIAARAKRIMTKPNRNER